MRRVVVWWAKPLHFLQTPLLPTAKFAKSPAKKLAAIERDRKQRCIARVRARFSYRQCYASFVHCAMCMSLSEVPICIVGLHSCGHAEYLTWNLAQCLFSSFIAVNFLLAPTCHLTTLKYNTVSLVRACLSIWLERFRGSQNEDERGPLSIQSSGLEFLFNPSIPRNSYQSRGTADETVFHEISKLVYIGCGTHQTNVELMPRVAPTWKALFA